MSALYTQSSEERTFFSDKQITYVKREMNKQYTAGIMKLAGPTKKNLWSSFSLDLGTPWKQKIQNDLTWKQKH